MAEPEKHGYIVDTKQLAIGIDPITLPFEAVLESAEQLRPMEDDE